MLTRNNGEIDRNKHFKCQNTKLFDIFDKIKISRVALFLKLGRWYLCTEGGLLEINFAVALNIQDHLKLQGVPRNMTVGE